VSRSSPSIHDRRKPHESTEQKKQSESQPKEPKKKRLEIQRGGFDAAIMGQFVANATTAIIPLATYTGYKWWKSETGKK